MRHVGATEAVHPPTRPTVLRGKNSTSRSIARLGACITKGIELKGAGLSAERSCNVRLSGVAVSAPDHDANQGLRRQSCHQLFSKENGHVRLQPMVIRAWDNSDS